MLINVQTVRDSCRKMEVDDVICLESEFNLIDPLTMIKLELLLIHISETSNLDHLVGQWILRKRFDKTSAVIKAGM